MDVLTKFDAVGEIRDLEELRGLTRDAVALAKQAMAERDDWRQRYEDFTADVVSIPEYTLDEMARMVTARDRGKA